MTKSDKIKMLKEELKEHESKCKELNEQIANLLLPNISNKIKIGAYYQIKVDDAVTFYVGPITRVSDYDGTKIYFDNSIEYNYTTDIYHIDLSIHGEKKIIEEGQKQYKSLKKITREEFYDIAIKIFEDNKAVEEMFDDIRVNFAKNIKL